MCDDLPVVDDDQPLAERVSFFHVVRGQHDRFAELVVFANDLPEQDARLRIEPGARLIEKQNLRIVHHGAGDRQALHHSAGKSTDHLRGAIGELEFFEQFVGALAFLLSTGCRSMPREKSGSRGRSKRNRDWGVAAPRRSAA